MFAFMLHSFSLIVLNVHNVKTRLHTLLKARQKSWLGGNGPKN